MNEFVFAKTHVEFEDWLIKTVRLVIREEMKAAPMGPSNDDLMTREQACDMLQISKGTLDSLIRHGRIPPVRIGRAVRVRRGDVLAYLEAKKGPGRHAKTF